MTSWPEGEDLRIRVESELLYRVVFREEFAYTLPQMCESFYRLDRLVWAVAIGSAGDSPTARSWFADEETWRRISATADDIALRTKVSQVRRESPLEVFLAVTVAGSAGIAFGNRLLNMFDRFQDARLKKARTDVQVVALEVINEALTGTKAGPKELEGPSGKKRKADLRAAAQALAAIDRLDELLPGE